MGESILRRMEKDVERFELNWNGIEGGITQRTTINISFLCSIVTDVCHRKEFPSCIPRRWVTRFLRPELHLINPELQLGFHKSMNDSACTFYGWFMSGPVPPRLLATNPMCSSLIFHRSTKIMSQVVSDSDTISLSGGLFDIALASDLDGLSDTEVQEELGKLSTNEQHGSDGSSGEEDNVNVTIKEGIRPSHEVTTIPPRVASVLVVPESTKRTISNLLPRSDRVSNDSARSTPGEVGARKNVRNRNGSTKKKVKNSFNSEPPGSIVSMLSRVRVSSTSSNGGEEGRPTTPKRNRSPGMVLTETHTQPAKLARTVAPTPTPRATVENPITSQSYSDVAKKTLNLKVCLADRPPLGSDLNKIKKFLNDKIEESIISQSFVPIFARDCFVGRDGFYTPCSNFSCAEWLMNTVGTNIPDVDSKIIVLPHDSTVPVVASNNLVRVVVHVPTRKPNDFILNAMARLNNNLDTGKWRINNRRFKGATKSTLYMRMDKDSYQTIVNQGNVINWILGQVDIMKEIRSKPKHGKVSSEGVQPTAIRNPVAGIQTSTPTSSEGMDVDHTAGLTPEEGSGLTGGC